MGPAMFEVLKVFVVGIVLIALFHLALLIGTAVALFSLGKA